MHQDGFAVRDSREGNPGVYMEGCGFLALIFLLEMSELGFGFGRWRRRRSRVGCDVSSCVEGKGIEVGSSPTWCPKEDMGFRASPSPPNPSPNSRTNE